MIGDTNANTRSTEAVILGGLYGELSGGKMLQNRRAAPISSGPNSFEFGSCIAEKVTE